MLPTHKLSLTVSILDLPNYRRFVRRTPSKNFVEVRCDDKIATETPQQPSRLKAFIAELFTLQSEDSYEEIGPSCLETISGGLSRL
jgi:hypothetical protein